MIFGCFECGQKIETLFLGKRYCGPRCRKRAENRRSREREGAARDPQGEKRTDALMVEHNPTRALLEATALVYQQNGSTKPSVFTGTIPSWTCPIGVLWQKCPDRSWLMMGDFEVKFEAEHGLFVPEAEIPVTAMDILNKVLGVAEPLPELPPEEKAKPPLHERYANLPMEQPGLTVPAADVTRPKLTPEQIAYQAEVDAEERELLNDL